MAHKGMTVSHASIVLLVLRKFWKGCAKGPEYATTHRVACVVACVVRPSPWRGPAGRFRDRSCQTLNFPCGPALVKVDWVGTHATRRVVA
eukprot:g45407.t1